MPKQDDLNKKLSKRTLLGLFALVFVVLLVDQTTKIWANNAIELYEKIPVIDGVFNLTLAYNKGAAFSFLANQTGWQRWFFTGLALVVSLVLLVWLFRLKPQEKWLGVCLALILGGAVGNLIDRVLYGHVIDFLDFFYKNNHWPAFNVADMAICVGGVSMVLVSFLVNEDKNKTK